MQLLDSQVYFNVRVMECRGVPLFTCYESSPMETNHTYGVSTEHYVTTLDFEVPPKCVTKLSEINPTQLQVWTGSALHVVLDKLNYPMEDQITITFNSDKRFLINASFYLEPAFLFNSWNAHQLFYRFDVPKHKCLMVSFSNSAFDNKGSNFEQSIRLEVSLLGNNNEWISARNLSLSSRTSKPNAALFMSSVLVTLLLKKEETAQPLTNGLQILSSYHRANESITEISPGLFNCSQHYAAFRHHLGCNLRRECLGGEDETEACPYTNHRCPYPHLYVQGKCLTLQENSTAVNMAEARQTCQAHGGDLAMMKTQEEITFVRYLWNKGLASHVFLTGLQKNPLKRMRFWLDGTPDYYSIMPSIYFPAFAYVEDPIEQHYPEVICAHLILYHPVYVYLAPCKAKLRSSFLCEQTLSRDKEVLSEQEMPVQLPDLNVNWFFTRPDSVYVDCDGGRFCTHQFLLCDARSGCGASEYPKNCYLNSRTIAAPQQLSVAMFECYKTREAVHYTLVCDYRHDCSDGSDEADCRHQHIGWGFRCSSDQWINEEQVCDKRTDCLDGSDEQVCLHGLLKINPLHRSLPPAILYDGGLNGLLMKPLDNTQYLCPSTHFPCPGAEVYCMPAHFKCNGVKDCLGGEDEVSCDDVTCPGYYRCRSSSVCLHVDHVCDGWPQCPQRDDEWLCDVTCPSACHCQGLAFVCHQPFPATRYPDLRYLDATGSDMAPRDVGDMFYLVYLRLADCGFADWPANVLPNLQTLDLSHNLIIDFHMNALFSLSNLRNLFLSGNPLNSLFSTSYNRNHTSLTHLKLDHTLIKQINISALAVLNAIEQINVSFSALSNFIYHKDVPALKRLSVIDVRGCNVENIPQYLFRELYDLHLVYATNYQFCCREVLPVGFNMDSCFSDRDVISSCSDLLGSEIYKIFLWISAVATLLGNSFSLVFRMCTKHEFSNPSFSMFLINLGVSDFCLGLYLLVIGSANEMYHGKYLWHENAWKTSLTCNLAGLLCLLCYEVSALMVCLITVDRFVVLRFPFSTVRFTGRSAVAASVLTWTSGLVLAAVPMLPALSHWRFYSQTGLCVPLPLTRQNVPGGNYSFAILIVFNFLVFLVISLGQLLIFRSIQSNTLEQVKNSDASKNASIAVRLVTVAVADFLCWFPIGVLGLASSSGVPIPGEVSVAVVIFVLPINSALNPFLYTYSTVMERRHRLQQTKLLKDLKSQLAN